MKQPLINVSLQRYGTRMLSAGDPFEANRKDARVLVALGKAQHAEESEDTANDLAAKRAEYQTKFGKKPFNGWSAAELAARIAAGPARG